MHSGNSKGKVVLEIVPGEGFSEQTLDELACRLNDLEFTTFEVVSLEIAQRNHDIDFEDELKGILSHAVNILEEDLSLDWSVYISSTALIVEEIGFSQRMLVTAVRNRRGFESLFIQSPDKSAIRSDVKSACFRIYNKIIHERMRAKIAAQETTKLEEWRADQVWNVITRTCAIVLAEPERV